MNELQLLAERRCREDAEARAAALQSQLRAAEATLEASYGEKKQLEAELLEAAYDVLQKQKLETALQVITNPFCERNSSYVEFVWLCMIAFTLHRLCFAHVA